MKKISIAVACVAAFAAVLAFASACDNTDITQQPCRDIPDGGCPAYDNACDDPTCFMLYDCSPDDTWVVDKVCPAKTSVDADGILIDAGRDAAGNVDASAYLNVPGALGGPGCQDLQNPDCSLGAAAACTDCCGCEDLYVCQSGGWSLWGECANGHITENDGGS